MDDLYRENLMDHYQHPRHHGPMAECDAEAEGKTRSAEIRSSCRSS